MYLYETKPRLRMHNICNRGYNIYYPIDAQSMFKMQAQDVDYCCRLYWSASPGHC